jgi:hypothetical protein
MRPRFLFLVFLVAVLLVACSSADPTSSDEYAALEQELAASNAHLVQAEAALAQVTTERDAFAVVATAGDVRYDKTMANAERVAAIVDDPDAFGTREEVLDELMTLATPEAVMDDTAFGSVSMRRAWSNTLWGSDATIKTWVKWMCEDGNQAGSLWTWEGESRSGKPFELIGVNIDDYDDEGRVIYSLVDWPYDGAYVRDAFSSGNTISE